MLAGIKHCRAVLGEENLFTKGAQKGFSLFVGKAVRVIRKLVCLTPMPFVHKTPLKHH